MRAVAETQTAGVALYVALFPSIGGETIEQRAERLKAAWCPEEAGLLVVADTFHAPGWLAGLDAAAPLEALLP